MNFRIHCTIWLISLIPGLCFALTRPLLNFWLSNSSISAADVGLFSLVALPYCINFIWTPVVDRLRLPILADIFGQRLSWSILLQVILSISVFLLSFTNPSQDLVSIAFLTFFIALVSSTHDNILGVLRSEILPVTQQGAVSASYVVGYRIGTMLCHFTPIYLSLFLSWQQIYQIIAASFLIFPICLVALMHKQHIWHHKEIDEKTELSSMFSSIGPRKFIVTMFSSVGSLKFIISILIFLVLYAYSA
jgi:PAT family beta-lactamase induction signal transducer AmpG